MMNRFARIAGWLVILLLTGTVITLAQEPTPSFEGDPAYPAVPFPPDVEWLNVAAPLTLGQLRGKVVLLDFWTYGCINCIHMIPTIQRLEDKYGDALAVIGVHSAKFENEGQTENLRQIIQRYGLHHPVINDSDFRVWRSYSRFGVNAWPTFVVIDPRGNLFAVQAGEVPFEAFDTVIGGMIAYFDGLGEINREPLVVAVEGEGHPASALYFPGKVLADPLGNRLFIADSSHHRIVVADLLTYEVLDVIGSGEPGAADGAYEAAQFRRPQGMALRDNILYVADTQNHLIRAVRLTEREVTTFAGTGVQGYNRDQSGPPLAMDLASPWDVTFGDDDTLYIAMAGTHQIWAYRFSADLIAPVVGSGREGLVEDALLAAQLAQPSGLYFRDNQLYFADSESSSIRVADLTEGRTAGLAGPPMNDLFAFGDVDGGFGDSRLQHPLAVIGLEDGRLAVADTYNHKIKLLDPITKEIVTFTGQGGTGGFRDGDLTTALFDEPGGLATAAGKLYVADTNNHAIRVIDLASQTVSTVVFPNPELLQIGGRVTVVGGNNASDEIITLDAQTAQAGTGAISLNIQLPEGYKFNNLAPFSARWSADGTVVALAEADQSQSLIEPVMPLVIPVTLNDGSVNLTVDVTTYYCEAINESLCFIDQVTLVLPVIVSAEGSSTGLSLTRVIVPPSVPSNGIGG